MHSLNFLIHLIFSFDKKPLSDMSMAGLCSNLVNLIMKKLCSISYSHLVVPDPNAFFIKFGFCPPDTENDEKADLV